MAVIRRRQGSLWDAVREAPRDWLLHLAEDYELIDWSRVSEATSWPCALVLNGLFVLVSLARQISAHADDADVLVDSDRRRWSGRGSSDGRSDRYADNATDKGSAGSTVASVLLFLQVSLYIVSIANAWRLFASKRAYQLRMTDIGATAPTSSCRRVAAGSRRPSWSRSFAGRCLWAVWRWISRTDEQGQDEIWELSLWTPPMFSRNLFCWYSPVQLLVLSFMDGSNWYYILPLAAAVAGQCTFVVFAYSTLVKDKQILFGEVHNEYNQKFVNPRVFAPKADVSTSTADDWQQAGRLPSGVASSGLALARARIEQIKRNDSARRRTTALVAEDTDYQNYPPRDVRRDAPRYKYVESGEPRYRHVGGDEPGHGSAGEVEPRYRQADERTSVAIPHSGASGAEGYMRPRPTVSAVDRLYESQYRAAAVAPDRHGGSERLGEPYTQRAEPIGTQRVRDRSSQRRRYTSALESPRRNPYM
ncbi:hypothetical protein LPJ61_005338 [Coemansia biformis]|uniref:Nuclear rim protein 1 n=1 Tax=Coemansia biformis TaxID=1286918 RepID=A0A9W7Y7L4_9FUNG|nr:hypothetical protein LPJ61_005338 [Coemansia biformis]